MSGLVGLVEVQTGSQVDPTLVRLVYRLLDLGYSERDLARHFKISRYKVRKILKALGLKTIYQPRNQYRKPRKPTVEKVTTKEEVEKYSWFIDVTTVSVKTLRSKQLRYIDRSDKWSIITLVNIQNPAIRIAKFIHLPSEKVKKSHILETLKLLNIDPKTVLGDTRIGLTKLGIWNCSVNLCEKNHGIKVKIYQYLKYLETQGLKLNSRLVLGVYKQILARHGWIILD